MVATMFMESGVAGEVRGALVTEVLRPTVQPGAAVVPHNPGAQRSIVMNAVRRFTNPCHGLVLTFCVVLLAGCLDTSTPQAPFFLPDAASVSDVGSADATANKDVAQGGGPGPDVGNVDATAAPDAAPKGADAAQATGDTGDDTAGPADAGKPMDAGESADAGAPWDASSPQDVGAVIDAGSSDAGAADAGAADAGLADVTAAPDAAPKGADAAQATGDTGDDTAGPADAGKPMDAGESADAGAPWDASSPQDAGAVIDAGSSDAGAADAGAADAGLADAGPTDAAKADTASKPDATAADVAPFAPGPCKKEGGESCGKPLGGDADDLYVCKNSNWKLLATCQKGCQGMPDGVPDRCVEDLEVPGSLVNLLDVKPYVEQSCSSTTHPDWPFAAKKCTYTSGGITATVITATPSAEKVAAWIVDSAAFIPALWSLRYLDPPSYKEGLKMIGTAVLGQSSRIFPIEGVILENMSGNGWEKYPFVHGVSDGCSSGCYCRINSLHRSEWCDYQGWLGKQTEADCLKKVGTSGLTKGWGDQCLSNHVAAWDDKLNHHFRAKARTVHKYVVLECATAVSCSPSKVLARMEKAL